MTIFFFLYFCGIRGLKTRDFDMMTRYADNFVGKLNFISIISGYPKIEKKGKRKNDASP